MSTETLDKRALIPDSALIALNETTCTWMLDLMERAATQPDYEPYGLKATRCPKCDGHKKALCYMRRTQGLEITEEIRELYADRIKSIKR